LQQNALRQHVRCFNTWRHSWRHVLFTLWGYLVDMVERALITFLDVASKTLRSLVSLTGGRSKSAPRPRHIWAVALGYSTFVTARGENLKRSLEHAGASMGCWEHLDYDLVESADPTV
jgi:hypothetical protein